MAGVAPNLSDLATARRFQVEVFLGKLTYVTQVVLGQTMQ